MRRSLPLAALLLLSAIAPAMAETMPQLDFGNPLTLSQVVWMAIIFAVLYLLFARWGLPQVASVLEERQARITADLDAARQAKAEADAAVRELGEATRRAHAESQTRIAAAMSEAKARAAAEQQALNQRLDARLEEAETRIAGQRDRAMGALREVAASATATVVTRLSGITPDENAVGQAVARAMARQTTQGQTQGHTQGQTA